MGGCCPKKEQEVVPEGYFPKRSEVKQNDEEERKNLNSRVVANNSPNNSNLDGSKNARFDETAKNSVALNGSGMATPDKPNERFQLHEVKPKQPEPKRDQTPPKKEEPKKVELQPQPKPVPAPTPAPTPIPVVQQPAPPKKLDLTNLTDLPAPQTQGKYYAYPCQPTREQELAYYKQQMNERKMVAEKKNQEQQAEVVRLQIREIQAKELAFKDQAKAKLMNELKFQKELARDEAIQEKIRAKVRESKQRKDGLPTQIRRMETSDIQKTRIEIVKEYETKASNTLSSRGKEIEAADQRKAQETMSTERQHTEIKRSEISQLEQKPREIDQFIDSQLSRLPNRQEMMTFNERFSTELSHRGLNSEIKSVTSILYPTEDSGRKDWNNIKPLTVEFQAAGVANKAGPSQKAVSGLIPVDLRSALNTLNLMRASPRDYSQIVRVRYLNNLDSLNCHKITLRQYEEGRGAILEAVKVLESMEPMAPLVFDAGLCVAAHVQAKRQAYERRVFGEERAQACIENVAKFASLPQGALLLDCNVEATTLAYEDIFVNMFIGDGDASRRARNAMMKPGMAKCGFGVFQRTANGPLFCTLILADRNVQGNKGQIPADLLQQSCANQV